MPTSSLRPLVQDGLRAIKQRELDRFGVETRRLFADNVERVRRQLDQAGITFVGKTVLPKHLGETKPRPGRR